MGIYALHGLLTPRLCRQTFLWSTMSRRILPRPVAVIMRDTHSSLYQMVKKRTLEARTKLQSNKFPNNQACAAQSQSTVGNTTSKVLNISKKVENSQKTAVPIHSTPINRIKPNYPGYPSAGISTSKKVKYVARTPTVEDNFQPNESRNAEILRARGCDIKSDVIYKKSKEPPKEQIDLVSAPTPEAPKKILKNPKRETVLLKDPCVKDEKGAYKGAIGSKTVVKDGKCSDDGGNEKKDRMLLYALLAALGAGGLFWWLFGRKKCKESDVAIVHDGKDGPKSIPASSADLPKHVPYLLIGGGTAAFSAFRAIKSNDPQARVLMITDEMKKPYMRPPLSKELWYSAARGEGMRPDMRFKQWTGAERSLYFEPEEFFVDPTQLLAKPNGGVSVAQGFKVRKVNPEKRIVTLEDGYEISYDECLIATGCSPKTLSLLEDAPNSVKDKIMVYRTPDDFERIKKYADENKTIAVIGNGFTGSELSCSLANYTKGTKARIYQIFPEIGNMSRVLPQYLSRWTTKKIESTGVMIINKASVKEITREDSKLLLTLSNGKTILADVAVVCVGCEPNTDLAATSGLEVSKRLGGFVVNSELEARRNLYVAGDASCFYDPLLGRRRVEHHDHSVVSGRLAGENMTGKNNSYTHQSMFWSDLGPEIGYEGIGLVDASLPTVGVFALPSKTDTRTDNLTEVREEKTTDLKTCSDGKPMTCDNDENEDNYGRGVIFYIKDNKIVGILLWNLFNRIGLARTIITQNKTYNDLNEVAKLFEIHS